MHSDSTRYISSVNCHWKSLQGTSQLKELATQIPCRHRNSGRLSAPGSQTRRDSPLPFLQAKILITSASHHHLPHLIPPKKMNRECLSPNSQLQCIPHDRLTTHRKWGPITKSKRLWTHLVGWLQWVEVKYPSTRLGKERGHRHDEGWL